MSEQPQDWASESRETNAYQHSTAARTDFRDIAKTCLQNLDTIQQLREQLAAEREKSEAQKLRAEMLEAQRNDARKQLAAERDRAELIRTWWKQEIENRKGKWWNPFPTQPNTGIKYAKEHKEVRPPVPPLPRPPKLIAAAWGVKKEM